MSESATALDLGFEVSYRGQQWKFCPIDNFKTVGLYEAYLEKEAWRALERAKANLPPAMYAEQSAGTRSDIAAGVYHFQGKGWRDSLGSPQHQRQLLWLMMVYHHRDAELTQMDGMFKDKACREEMQRALLVDFARIEDVDPNVLLEAAGLLPKKT